MKDIRHDLILTMFKTLYQEGYHASNLNAILKNAGTSKGGMYHHFDSKQSLAIAATNEVLGSFIASYWETPIESSENALQTLFDRIFKLSEAMITADVQIDFRYGCPINNLVQELSAIDTKFATLLLALFKRWEDAIVKALTVNRKLLRIDIDVQKVAAFIVASIEGSFSYAKIHHSKEAFDASMNQIVLYIQSLLR